VFVADGVARPATERQTYDDLLRLHRPALERTW
jgi:hypothetical protein